MITAVLYVGTRINNAFSNKDEEYQLIRNYLLNDSPIYGLNKPKIWIHSKFEYNARAWESFYSRSSTGLNQPYLNITIKSIIDKCGDDFHICLISDDTFSKLLPSWDINVSQVAEPMKHHMRELGMAQLVYHYGGMVVPNSFLCLDNLKEFFENATSATKSGCFVVETINTYENNKKRMTSEKRRVFIASTYMMGASKRENENIGRLVTMLKQRYLSTTSHFSSVHDFGGDSSYWCMDEIQKGNLALVGGEYIGIKTNCGEPIYLDHLLSDNYLKLHDQAVGIYIPQEEVLKRTKYSWFAMMSETDVLESNIIISTYMKSVLIDNIYSFYSKEQAEMKKIMAI
jgi:hypothetical protein